MTMKRLTSVTAIIKAFGGRRKFAKVMQTSPQAVDNWRRAKLFPANTYVMLQTELYIAGMRRPPDELWAMKRHRMTRRRRR